MGYVRQHYLNLFKAENQREKSEFHEFVKGEKKKVPHNFFIFPEICPNLRTRAQALGQTIFFFGLSKECVSLKMVMIVKVYRLANAKW